MGGIAATLLPESQNQWEPAAAGELSGRDEVVHRSHLVGSDAALTKEGGGNFSAKGVVTDHRGRATDVLWMSAWGCDGAVTTPEDFPVLRLDDLRLLRHGGPVSETAMIDHLLACGMRADQPRPGIETLTHAFLRATHVDHCHPDAVIALTSIPDGRERAQAEFGEEAIWFDYRQFDVDVARELADRVEANPRCRFVLLANHGLFTWADTSEECYRNSLEAVARATRALDAALRRPADLGGTAVAPLPKDTATRVLADVLPVMRGELSRGTPGVVLHLDRSPEAVAFASSVRGPGLSLRGPACPDHLVTVGHRPLVLPALGAPGDQAARAATDGIQRHREWYDRYYEENVTGDARSLGRRSDAPRAVVLPGIGVVTSGSDAAKARLCRDHYAQTMTVVRIADAAGGYVALSEAQGAADEYWPLMRLKPQLLAAEGRLAFKVALVACTDASRAIAVAERLAHDGAHVLLAGGDVARVRAAAERITRAYGERRAVAFTGRPEEAEAVVRAAVLTFGGMDIVVDMSLPCRVARAALPVLARQQMGGAVLLGNVTGDAGDASELKDTVSELTTSPEARGLTVNAVESTDALAIGEAAVFFSGPGAQAWTGTTLVQRAAASQKAA